MKRTGRLGLWLLVIVLFAAGGYGLRTVMAARAQAADVAAIQQNPDLDPGTTLTGGVAPGFSLINQFDQPVSLRQFRGRVVILAFTDSQCTTICPLTSMSLLDAVHALGPLASHVALVGINANPLARSVKDVRTYSEVHGMLHQWNFLTGSLSQLKKVWQQYGVYSQVVEGAIDHTPAVYIIGPHGHERKLYMTQMAYADLSQQGNILAREAAVLLGHPHFPLTGSFSFISGQSPKSPVTLKQANPEIHGRSLGLGPGTPRLLVFFATWLRQISPLAQNLERLNAYRAVAAAHRWPPLIAIDETSTEPSPHSLSGFLSQLTVPLTYPVGEDVTGRVADGYGVKGQPWFEIVSAHGTILWSHNGWLSVKALEAAAARYSQ